MTNKPKFWEADEVREVAEADVIPPWHSDLDMFNIRYVFQEKLTDRGKTALAKIKKANPMEAYLGGHDIMVVANADWWPQLNGEQRIALLDHEFSHIEVSEDKEGNPKITIRPHDIEEFRGVVERHGAWWPDIEEFAKALQMPLPFDKK